MFKGSIVAIVTPFRKGKVDEKTLNFKVELPALIIKILDIVFSLIWIERLKQ